MHEALERVDLDQAGQQRALLGAPERLAERSALDLLAQPAAHLVGGDVLDLVGDRAAVGVAQPREGFGERRSGDEDVQQLGRDLGHQHGRQADRLRVKRRVAARRRAERVEVRREMSVGAQRAHQRVRGRGGLQQLLAGTAFRGRRWRLRVARGGSGVERHAERREDAVVERVRTAQQRVDPRQEAAGLGSLDDPVVVGRGERHHLLGADLIADLRQARRVADRAGRDDRALAGHQPGHRGAGAQAARVGERDVRADQVVGGQRVGPRLLDQLVVGGEELVEAQRGRRRG